LQDFFKKGKTQVQRFFLTKEGIAKLKLGMLGLGFAVKKFFLANRRRR
jgi:hypothetical protein